MADAEHPDDPGGGEGKGRSTGNRTQTRRNPPGESDAGAPGPSSDTSPGARAAQEPTQAVPAAGTVPAYEPPAPGSAPLDEGSQRGISGALALWGPLIIIGFLVLVLNTQEGPQTPAADEAAGPSPAAEATAPAEALPASLGAESAFAATEDSGVAAVESRAATEVPEQVPAADSAPQASASGASMPASAPEEPLPASPEPEVVEAAAGLSTETEGSAPQESAALDAPATEAEEGADIAGDLDLGAVLEVARAVIGQEVGEGAADVPSAPPAPAATLSAPEAPPATGVPAAPGAGGVAASSRSAPQAGGRGESPIWSSGANPWAVSPSTEDESMWNEGTGMTAGPAAGPEWPPPPPESAAAMPPLATGTAMFPGTGYWPRPPVLVPCAPPYYWCIALPAPAYHAAPGVGYP